MNGEQSDAQHEDSRSVPRRIAAILLKGLDNPEYLGRGGKDRWKDEVRAAATQPLFDKILAGLRKAGLQDLDFIPKKEPSGKKSQQRLDQIEARIPIDLDPFLSLFVRVGEGDKEKLFEKKLIWGFGMWGKDTVARKYLEANLTAFAPLDPDEERRLFKPPFGGASFVVVHSLSPDELKKTDLDSLAKRIITDLERRYGLLMDNQAEIKAKLGSTPKPSTPEKEGEPVMQTPLSATALSTYLASRGFRFTPLQIATYLTALQTKGFVILSGFSGTGKTKLAQAVADMLSITSNSPELCFQAVRPDWRDSKSLLGYFNPLTQSFEMTEFLRFLLHANAEYGKEGGTAGPGMVLLDEMNLARVEYYFADFLSVLESGRSDSGHTHEPIRFNYPPEATGELPPAEFYLPPNLYVTGTVNVDETTHAFSPKVLDRAFTVEFGDVDFTGYPPPTAAIPEWSVEVQETFRQAFTRHGRFGVLDRSTIRDFTEKHPKVTPILQALNARLVLHGLGFGFRVFDEIVAFMDNALTSPWRDGFGDSEGEVLIASLDAAACMKVLPKFHGPTGKLAEPLLGLLTWAENPEAPTEDRFESLRQQWVEGKLATDFATYLCCQTARKVGRMLQALRSTGFASFA